MSSRVLVCVLSTLIGLISCKAAQAQGRQLPSVVQLPSFSFFTFRGSVLVPDSGAAYLGGVNRSASGVTNRGRGLGHGIGGGLSHSGASIHATIIDHAEIDRQILGGTPQEFVQRERAKQALAGGKPNVLADPDAEGKTLVRFARKMYREGKHTKAFDGYLLALDVLSPTLRDLAADEFRRVFGPSADQAIRMHAQRR
jgi:hypothetical protein